MRGREAEKAAEKWLQGQGWTTHRALANFASRGGKTWANSNDVWGCIDIAAMAAGLGFWMVQVTTSGGVAARKHKVAAQPWPLWLHGPHVDGKADRRALRVSIWECKSKRDDLNPRKTNHFFRVHDLLPDGTWQATEVINL